MLSKLDLGALGYNTNNQIVHVVMAVLFFLKLEMFVFVAMLTPSRRDAGCLPKGRWMTVSFLILVPELLSSPEVRSEGLQCDSPRCQPY